MHAEYVFAPSAYSFDLEQELAKALQARTELVSRKQNPKLWRLTDRMNAYAAKGPSEPALKRRRIFRAALSGLLAVLGAAALISGLMEPGNRTLITVGVICLLLALARVLPAAAAGSGARFQRAAHQHLTSLRAVDLSQKPVIRFTEGGMRIQSNQGGKDYGYESMEALVETPRLFLLTHGGAATVLQKKDLVLGTGEEFTQFFLSHAPALAAQLTDTDE